MKAVIATTGLAGLLLMATAAWGQAAPEPKPLDAQYKAAQVEVILANVKLGLVQVQMLIQNGQTAQARQELARIQDALGGLASQADVTSYKRTADQLASQLAKVELANRVVGSEKSSDPKAAADETGPGYGRLAHPDQPGLQGQVDQAVEQVKLAEEYGYANVPGSRGELSTDPVVVKQRTLDHQGLWDDGRYAPAQELIDVGKLMELDRERVHYQYALTQVRDGARRDEVLHVVEATVPPPHVMNYPKDWGQITKERAEYAEGILWQSPKFKDTDGKEKTVAIYDVSDLLFVPIYPGPSEYNLRVGRGPRDPLRLWLNDDRYYDLFLYGPLGRGRGDGIGGLGGGYHVWDIIPPYYYPYEADPIYQYRLAQKRAELLQAINAVLSSVQD